MLNFMKGERKQKKLLPVAELFKEIENQAAELACPIVFESNHCPLKNTSLMADKDALIGALLNLLQNACDACANVTKPHITFSLNIEEQFCLTISDNGVGIATDDQKKIFEPFFTNKKNGNGLGLAIVHGVVIDHQGSIKVKSSENQGSEFQIKLPLVRDNLSPLSRQNFPQENHHEC
jgi:two-component system, sensor histidine kinase FlrB